jgi:hypothetical protein
VSLAQLNLFERIMRLMGVDEKGSPVAGNPRHEETIAEGRKLIDKAKRQMLGGGGGGGGGGAVGGSGAAVTRASGARDVEMTGAGGGRGGSTANPLSGGPGSSAAPPTVPGRFRTLESFSGVGGGGANSGSMSRGVVSGGEPEVVGLGSSGGAAAGGRFSTAFSSVGAGLTAFNSRAMAAFGGGPGGSGAGGLPPASSSSSSAYRPGSVAAGGASGPGSLRDFSSVALTLDPLDGSGGASGPQSLAAKLKGKRPGAPSSSSASSSSGPSTPARPTSGASSSTWAGAAGGQIS